MDPRAKYPNACDWTVHRFVHDLLRVFVNYDTSSTLPAWITKLRSLYPRLKERPPSSLLEEARRSSGIDLGVLDGREARRYVQQLTVAHFDVRVENASFVSYFPTVAGSGLIIEDPAEAKAFCLQLISEGAKVQGREG